jgi:prepilin-type N-terminal cleavage/methylation domain-containing protein/prepilin-type processing-associated H-X9-DG protein
MHTRHRFGFTLVEILVSIAVISILIAILLPALGHARTRAWRLKSETNLRSLGQFFEMYVNESANTYPAAQPNRFYNHFIGLSATMGHWQAAQYWHVLFGETLRWDQHESLLLSPGATRVTSGPVIPLPRSSYTYSASFLGSPDIWSGRDLSTLDEQQWTQLRRPARSHQVRSASSKVLLWEWELPYIRRDLILDSFANLTENVPMLFADGHVAGHIPSEATTGVRNFDPTAQDPYQNLHNTPQGVQGADY